MTHTPSTRELFLRKVAFESVPPDQWVSKAEQRIRNSIPDAQTLPARASGYNWGRRDENTRLSDIHAAVADLVEAASANQFKLASDGESHALCAALARLREVCEP